MSTETPTGPLEGLVGRLREYEGSDALGNGDFSLLREAADEIERLQGLIAELRDTELADMACTGSDAPVEDVLGRLFDAVAQPPNAAFSGSGTTRQQESDGLSPESAETHS